MIIEFSVQNFRSIYDKVTLSMMAAKLTGKEATLDNIFYHENYPNIPLLKSAVIYGANASGKSNVLKALHFFKNSVVNSTDNKFGEELDYQPFRLLKDAPKEPSCFEMDFIAQDGIRYIYGFKATVKEVLEEYLSIFTSRKETKLFIRKKGEKIQFSSSFKGEKKVLEEQLLKNNLLLSKAANSNYQQLQIIYTYFSHHINLTDEIKGTTYYSHEYYEAKFYTAKKINENDSFTKRVIDILRSADTGIENFKVKKYEDNGALFSIGDYYDIEVMHTYFDNESSLSVTWPLAEESEGTQKLFELTGVILDILDNGETLIFDEINNSLHPHLSKFIIDLFHNKKTNPKNAQLIFTTHDATLLTKENFRRDQVWFTSKNEKGMTQLYSLGDFDKKEVRWDIPFDRWYLTGRFGAVPNIQDYKLHSK